MTQQEEKYQIERKAKEEIEAQPLLRDVDRGCEVKRRGKDTEYRFVNPRILS